MTPKFHTLAIADLRKETDDTVSIAFSIPESLRSDYSYKSGQYLTLKALINGEDIRRSYSLCSSPKENEWRVAIKQVEGGKFSSFANNELKTGMELEVMTPAGNFLLQPDKNHKKTYLLVAAGSGITPILSIMKTVLAEEPESDIVLIYGNRGFSSIIFREEVEGLKNSYMDRLRVLHVLSRESLGNPLQKGRIDSEKVEKIIELYLNDTVDEAYICGPEEMIRAVQTGLEAKGVAKEKIHFELFTSPNAAKKESIELPKNSPKIVAEVTIILDGDELDIALDSTGKNILDAAQEAGADLPFACKGGVCCTCKAKIIEGTASMDVNYALEPDEVAAGYILTCQSHPTSERLIISFDE
jgi:ring-1,2-phenylacetyl-CoA epoxidase subunit PaaE